jgi:hypothetical protein
MAAKAIMVNLGQHRTAPATLCEEQLERAPGVVFRMESGSSDPNDTPQEKRQRRIPSKMDAENSQKLSENKRMVCNLAHTRPFKQDPKYRSDGKSRIDHPSAPFDYGGKRT